MTQSGTFFGGKFDRTEKQVTLPSGRSIVLMEMTGADESALTKLARKNFAEGMNKFLVRVCKDLDGKPGACQPEQFEGMLSGDRSALLLHLRVLTHGEKFEYKFTCDCEEKTDFEIDVADMIAKIKPYPNGDKRDFQIDIDGHPLCFSLPDGRVEKKIANDDEVDVNKRIKAMKFWEPLQSGDTPVSAEHLRARHLARVREELKKLEFEVDSTVSCKCPACGRTKVAEVSGDPNFLFPGLV